MDAFRSLQQLGYLDNTARLLHRFRPSSDVNNSQSREYLVRSVLNLHTNIPLINSIKMICRPLVQASERMQVIRLTNASGPALLRHNNRFLPDPLLSTPGILFTRIYMKYIVRMRGLVCRQLVACEGSAATRCQTFALYLTAVEGQSMLFFVLSNLHITTSPLTTPI